MANSLAQTTSKPAISPQLQQWLEWRNSLSDLKIKFQKDVARIALLPEAIDLHSLPDPLRSEAIEYMRTPDKEQITTREAFLKAFQLKVKYI